MSQTAPRSNGATHHVIDAEMFEEQMGAVMGSVENLRDDVRTCHRDMPAAMAAALRQVLTDPAVIDDMMGKVVATAQKRAAEKTGNAVGSLIKSLLTRWVIIGCILLMVAKTAGIDVAGKLWAVLKGAA